MQTMHSFWEVSDRNRKHYHRTVCFSSWVAALLHGNTAERTQRVCCRHTRRWSCWCSCTCQAHRPGCNVEGWLVGCKSSRTLSEVACHRCFAASEKKKEEDRLHWSVVCKCNRHDHILKVAYWRKLTNSWHDSGTVLVSGSSSSSEGSSHSSFGR